MESSNFVKVRSTSGRGNKYSAQEWGRILRTVFWGQDTKLEGQFGLKARVTSDSVGEHAQARIYIEEDKGGLVVRLGEIGLQEEPADADILEWTRLLSRQLMAQTAERQRLSVEREQWQKQCESLQRDMEEMLEREKAKYSSAVAKFTLLINSKKEELNALKETEQRADFYKFFPS